MQFFAIPNDCKRVGSDPVACRLYEREGDRRRNRCINRVAAALEHRKTGLSSQRMRRCDHIIRENSGATRWVVMVGAKFHGDTFFEVQDKAIA